MAAAIPAIPLPAPPALEYNRTLLLLDLSDGARDADDGDEERGVAVRHAVSDGPRRPVDVRHVVADAQQHRVQTEVVEDDAAKHGQVHHTTTAPTTTGVG